MMMVTNAPPVFSSALLFSSRNDINLKAVVSVKYSTNGALLACASADKKIHIYHTSSSKDHAITLEGEHSRGINDCAWLSEKLLVSSSDDQTIKVWDIEVLAVTSAGGSDGRLLFFHLSSKEPIMSFDAHSETVASIDCHTNGREILSGGHDGLTRVWDSAYTSCCVNTVVCDNDEQLAPISCVRYSPNGEYILLSSLKSLHRLFDRSSFVGFGSYLENDIYNTDTSNRWSPSSKFNPLPLRSYSSHTNTKYSIHSCFHKFSNQTYVLSGSECGEVYLWNLNTTAVATHLKAHDDAVLSVASHPDPTSSQFASASLDGSVKLFELSSDE